MKFTINTTVFQNLVAKSMKGASCNKMIPITGFMLVQVKDGKVTLLTTDAINYLYVSAGVDSDEDFYAVVQAELFSKLIAKLTSENTTLIIKDGNLVVNANGKYTLELPLDEEGKPVKFPDPISKISGGAEVEKIPLSTVRLILNTAKASLATTNEVPCYTGYYVGDKVIATDTYKICGINTKLFNKPHLISAETMALLDVMSGEMIEVRFYGDTVVFATDNTSVYGKPMDCINEYQIDAINGFLENSYPSSCEVSRAQLLQLLDRLSLFVSVYDKNGIYLTFTNTGIMVTSKHTNGTELIPYVDSKNQSPYSCCIDIEMFRSQVKAGTSDVVQIQYGEENAIKLVDGNITQVIALLEDDRTEE